MDESWFYKGLCAMLAVICTFIFLSCMYIIYVQDRQFTDLLGVSQDAVSFLENITLVNGCYYPNNKTFCVNPEQPYAQVMETCNHEYLHYKIDAEHWGVD